MIVDQICGDIYECYSRIEEDFEIDLKENITKHDVLLRGENFPYEKSESSMKRFLIAEDGKTMKPFYVVSPFIDFEDIYANYHSTVHNLKLEEGAGFLQHYGFPTDLFDLTPKFETARFFASYGRDSDPIGIIGAFRRVELKEYFTITDLSQHPFALRPKNQHAFVGRPRLGTGIVDLKNPKCDDLFTSRWYRFKKSTADLELAAARVSITYPSEQEISYFFSCDLDNFVKDHFTYGLITPEQQNLVQKMINSIRNQLTE